MPLGYFISFRAYGTWLHGDKRGSVDRKHNEFGTRMLPVNARRSGWEHAELKSPPMQFDVEHRAVIERTIHEVCEHRGWKLHELNARSNHVHVVVTAACRPEYVMGSLKAWGTRRLREAGLVEQDARVWSRHGSTIYLFKPEKFEEKCRYVREGQ